MSSNADSVFNVISPTSTSSVRALHVGQRVSLSGIIVTARDLAHKHLVESRPQELRDVLRGAFIYHCGPVAVPDGSGWRISSAGPTTSAREEQYQADVIREYGIAGVIGKGGMGQKTAAALAECGAVYLHATGGAGASLAASIKEVVAVFYLREFGVPEAMWVLRVENFPAVVSMDSHGGSLHQIVYQDSLAVRTRLII